MVPKIDHYGPLLRAVASLDRTSYEARGAIYDRALAIVVERLGATVPPPSRADIDQELLAFRAAVRRIEFGDMDEQERIAQHGVAQRAQYLAGRREQRPSGTPKLDAYPAALIEGGSSAVPPPDAALSASGASVLAEIAGRPSLLRRVAVRMILPVLLVALGLAGYAYESGQIGEPWRLLSRIAPAAWLAAGEGAPEPVEPAIYSEQTSGNVLSKELNGSARWRTRTEDAASGSQSGSHATVITLDLLIPERGLAMAMAIRRDASNDAAMTHLLEFKFSDRKGAPFDGIAGVGNIVMKQADESRGRALAGLSIKVAPGVFLFGLSADKDDARHNAEALRALSRLDIPVNFADGSAATISLNKGESGERAFGTALPAWER